MKKMSLRMRLTCMSALLLTISCIILYLVISNSALMNMDTIETNTLSFTIFESEDLPGGDFTVNLNSAIPEIIENLNKTKQSFKIDCLILTICIIVFGTALTWFLSGIALKPLKKLNQEVGEITASNLSTELPVSKSKDEISQLTSSFNLMLKRLDSAFLSQKQFTANAAHELRTPLAVMQTNLEVFNKKNDKDTESYQNVLNTTLRQTEQLGALTNSLLELMSLHTATLSDKVELSGLTAEIFCDLAPIAESKGIELRSSGPEITIHGNEVLLYRTFYNLIENAIKYNRDLGTVEVNIEPLGDKVIVSVSDTGNGIAKESWGQIFEPFYRVDKARSRSMGGAGLGLALVNDIVTLHSGKAYIKESSNEGTTFCVEFPISGS